MTGTDPRWHVPAALLTGYLDDRLPETPAASVEAHLMSCAACRGELAQQDRVRRADRHAGTWEVLVDRLDALPGTRLERVLGALLPRHVVRLLAAAPSFRAAWWAAGIGLLALSLAAALLAAEAGGTALFVVAAPLVPLAGVALAYRGADGLAGEIVRTAPYPRFRLLLWRTLAVVASTLPVAGLLSLALPVGASAALLWLAPAVALCTLALALSARFDTERVAAGLAVLWLLAASGALRRSPVPLAVEELLARAVVFRPAGQAALVLVAALALLVAVVRRSTFEERSRA